jgi:hypothetical protein
MPQLSLKGRTAGQEANNTFTTGTTAPACPGTIRRSLISSILKSVRP